MIVYLTGHHGIRTYHQKFRFSHLSTFLALFKLYLEEKSIIFPFLTVNLSKNVHQSYQINVELIAEVDFIE